ncbi:MAG: ROK family protein [Candidatus Paceibacterota bacterium]
MTYLMLDIGGTKTRLAVSDDLSVIKDKSSFKTKKGFDDAMSEIVKQADVLMGKNKVKGIAVGIRGRISEDKSGIHNDATLSNWANRSIVEALGKHFKTDVYVENDTAMAGLGEANFGAGKGMDIVVYHTISTGVGGVKIEHGVIDEASEGFEPGHQVLDIDRTILGEEITPTLENLVSGTGLETRMGVKPYEIPQSDMIWDELAEYLAQGLRNTILYWSPDVIVLGGSMIHGDPRIEIEAIRKYTVEALDGFVTCPFITMAEFKDESGLYGAMAYLEQKSLKH